jgi:hypothetical protein
MRPLPDAERLLVTTATGTRVLLDAAELDERLRALVLLTAELPREKFAQVMERYVELLAWIDGASRTSL